MRYGLLLGSPTIAQQVATAQRAEAAGFDSVWTIEFFNAHGLVRLAAVAQATQRVRVGSAIAYVFMRSPVLAATAAMDIDEISGGRMVLGVGSGTSRMNRDWYAIAFDDPPAPRMKDAIGLVRAVFAAQAGEGLRYEGPYYRVDNPAFVRAHAARPSIPVYMAAVNKGMIAAAAEVADGLVGHPVFTRRYIREAVLPKLEGTRCRLLPYVITAIAERSEQARDEARAQIAFYYTTRLYHSILEPHGWKAAGEAAAAAYRNGDRAGMLRAIPDEMVDEIAVAGTPDEVRERLRAWDSLAGEVLLYSPTFTLSEGRVQENLDAIVDVFGR